MRHGQWLCDCLHLPQWIVKFHSSYELTEKDTKTVLRSSAVLPRHCNWGCGPPSETYPVGDRRARISDEDKTWVVNLACQKPKKLGYAQELWTTRMLAKHIRKHCGELGQPSLSKLGRGTVSKILAAHPVRPHKLEYYLERRDPEFEAKMIEVLHVYREVGVWRTSGLPIEVVGVLSYDEKPGIQAIGNTAPDLPPVPGCHATVGRDHEYRRHGTVSLLAGIDLRSGEVLGLVRDRHRRCGICGVSAPGRSALSCRSSHSHGVGQSLGPHLEGDPNVFGQRPESIRLYLHPQAGIVAQPAGVILWEAGQNPAAWHPSKLKGGVTRPH